MTISTLLNIKKTSSRHLSKERERRKKLQAKTLQEDVIPPKKENIIEELRRKNQQCLDYIARTERLLALIRSEQGRIHGELESIGPDSDHTKDLSDNSTASDSDTSSPDEYSDSSYNYNLGSRSKNENDVSISMSALLNVTKSALVTV